MNSSGYISAFLESSDLEDILRIEREVHQHPWSRIKFEPCFNHPRLYVLGLRKSDELCAYLVFQALIDQVEIQNIAVTKALQGQGIGALLLDALFNHCLQLNIVEILLEVRQSNQMAQKLYRSKGFTEVGKRRDYYPAANGREDALLFTRHLSQFNK